MIFGGIWSAKWISSNRWNITQYTSAVGLYANRMRKKHLSKIKYSILIIVAHKLNWIYEWFLVFITNFIYSHVFDYFNYCRENRFRLVFSPSFFFLVFPFSICFNQSQQSQCSPSITWMRMNKTISYRNGIRKTIRKFGVCQKAFHFDAFFQMNQHRIKRFPKRALFICCFEFNELLISWARPSNINITIMMILKMTAMWCITVISNIILFYYGLHFIEMISMW